MRPIIIGAGRGRRLRALTDSQPKCYAPIGGRRILDWIIEALAGAGLQDPVFIGGYQIERIRADYPHLIFCHNANWENNNILASLFCAEEYMAEGFVCSYADILYRPSVVRRALDQEGDIALCVDTEWRARYAGRSQHPEEDAEKVMVVGNSISRISRAIPSQEAQGEYIGVARFSARGAAWLREYYHQASERWAGKVWRDGALFEKAYLIHLFQEMLEQGVPFHAAATSGQYMEIDTEEDYALASECWPRECSGR